MAILFITFHHVLLFGADVCGYLSTYDPGTKGVAGVALNSVVVTGVSLFVMITGWFGVRRVWQPLLRLVIVCAVFGAAAYGLATYALPSLFEAASIPVKATAPDFLSSLKFTNWWFIVHYLMLLLIAPLLERALDKVTRRNMEHILLCLLVFNLLFGFAWGYVNASGYNVIQFVLLYLLARYLRLFADAPLVRFVRRYAWMVIAVCAAAITMLFLADKGAWQPRRMPMVWNYNCPLVILEAVTIFSLFTKRKGEKEPKSQTSSLKPQINFVARFVLGVYLLQSAPAIVPFRNALGSTAYEYAGYAGVVVTVVLIATGCWLVSWLILSLLNFVLRSPKSLFPRRDGTN